MGLITISKLTFSSVSSKSLFTICSYSACSQECSVHKCLQCPIRGGIRYPCRRRCTGRRCRFSLTWWRHWWRNGCCKCSARARVGSPFRPCFLRRIWVGRCRSWWSLSRISIWHRDPSSGPLWVNKKKVPRLIRSRRVISFGRKLRFRFRILVNSLSFSTVITLF